MEHQNSSRALVMKFIKAYELGDLDAIQRMLHPNFRDWRKELGELSKFEFLRHLEILFAASGGGVVDIHNVASEGNGVAVEMTIRLDEGDRRQELRQHDLFVVEDDRVIAIHEYGDDARL